ncbi:MAG: COX15/CtaA family protein [Alphaproteobacteria bacterium]
MRLSVKPAYSSVFIWLLICCAMIFVMAIIGAITRLTESGLSITDWNPVMGALPPLNEADWNKAFESYKQIPQYQVLNSHMTLEEFKGIFFWEWVHRLWGRLIGFVFALPLLVFWLQKKIDNQLALKLFAIFALGGLQGFIGWFMVQSGLELRTSVSPYRLALHLGLALLVYALILWQALRLTTLPRHPVIWCLRRHGWSSLGLLILTILWGALVAGLRAGEAYNTWPLMDGEILPAAAFTLLPQWLNIFENLALVQFIHRWLGPLTALAILTWAFRLYKLDRFWASCLGFMAVLQVVLGISTVLAHAHIVLATLHQAGAIVLLTLLIINLYRLKRLA